MVGILLLTGCESLIGPRKRSPFPEKVDDPNLTIKQQERRARDQLAYPDGSTAVAPRTFAEVPTNANR